MNEKEYNKIIELIYEGGITEKNLPRNLFTYTFQKLIEQVNKGYGTLKQLRKNSFKYNKALMFRTNINVFSGAKTWHNIRDLRDGLEIGGSKLPFKEFQKYARSVNETYNKNWLKSEMQATKQMSISANKWDEFEEQKELFPLLKYVTVGDAKVRPDHAMWDGLVYPVNDSFWDTRMPPNDWGCRCDVQQLTEGKVSRKSTVKNDSKLFANNPGKDDFIFDPNVHPYFKEIPREDKSNNFGLGFK